MQWYFTLDCILLATETNNGFRTTHTLQRKGIYSIYKPKARMEFSLWENLKQHLKIWKVLKLPGQSNHNLQILFL